jgi:hypothetical protein
MLFANLVSPVLTKPAYRLFPKSVIDTLAYRTNGFIVYNRYSKLLTLYTNGWNCHYRWNIQVVKIENDVITMPGHMEVRDIKTNNICRWDAANRLLINMSYGLNMSLIPTWSRLKVT